MKFKIIILLFALSTLVSTKVESFFGVGFGGRRGGLYVGLGAPFYGGYGYGPYYGRYAYGYPYYNNYYYPAYYY